MDKHLDHLYACEAVVLRVGNVFFVCIVQLTRMRMRKQQDSLPTVFHIIMLIDS